MTDDDRFWIGPASAPDTYQLITCLGGGAEGEVWTGVLPLSAEGRRNVAIKILAADTDGADEEAWISHGHLLRSIAHPGLVRVIEAFTGPAKHRAGLATRDTARYIIMDLVEGATLREWLDDHPEASASQRLRTLVTVATALDEMHSGAQTKVPVAHGDVKPSNIILRADGSTVLVDLGLTRLADGAGRVGRSRPYAAPELFQPNARNTPEADRFAFVATVVHTLVGEPPPVTPDGGPDLAATAARLQANPLTARRPILVSKLMEALTVAPPARPASLRTWLSALTDTLSQVTESADRPIGSFLGPPTGQTWTATEGFVPPPQPVVVPQVNRPRRRTILVSAIVAMVLVAGVVVAILVGGNGGNKTPAALSTHTQGSGDQVVPPTGNTPTSSPSLAPSPSSLPSASPSPSAPEVTSPSPNPTDTEGPAEGTPIAGSDNFIASSSLLDTSTGNIDINGQTAIDGFTTYYCCGSDTTIYNAQVAIDLGRSYKTFHARLGIEDHSEGKVPIEFKIYADGRMVFDKSFTLGHSQDLTLNVTGVLRLEMDFKGQIDRAKAAVGDPTVK